jgi:predicted acetyltransferase
MVPNVALRKIDFSEKEILGGMFLEYAREILPENEFDTTTALRRLDTYWNEEERSALFIMGNDKIAGFVLINSFCVVEVREPRYSIAEFYVKESFRKNKVGTLAAIKAFNLFRGYWEVRQMATNKAAMKFWKMVITNYTSNKFESISMSNEQWSGEIQLFSNGL